MVFDLTKNDINDNLEYLLPNYMLIYISTHNAYVSHTTTNLSNRLTMYIDDSNTITLHLETHFIPKSKFRKILVENTTIIEQEINKLRL